MEQTQESDSPHRLSQQARGWAYEARYQPTRIIGWLLAIALAYLVIAPLFTIVLDAFKTTTFDSIELGTESGSFTLHNFQRVFTSDTGNQVFWTPLWHTLTVGFFATSLALIFGLSLAMLVARTNIYGRRALGFLLIIPYMLPSQAFATAWSTLFRNRRSGGAQGMVEAAGITPPDWLAYGPVPISICLALNYFPFAFLLFSNALNKIDVRLIEAAQALGAPQRQIWAKILLPLLLPTTMSVLLLTVARTLGTFATPYVLGTPTGYRLLSTSLYASIRSGSSGTASVLAIVLASIGIFMVLMDIKFVKNLTRFVTVGGKGGGSESLRLRGSRLPLSFYAWIVFLIAAVAPLAVMFISTVTRTPGVIAAGNFTLKYWLGLEGAAGVFSSPEITTALLNTLLIAGTAAVACGILGMLVGYVAVSLQGSKLAGFLRQVSFMPYLIPGLAFAAAMLSLFAVRRGPIPSLYGTISLLILTMVVAYLPFSSRTGISSMSQIGPEPEEAGKVLGAGYWRRLGAIMLPLQKSALVTAIVLPFISGMKELSLVVMLVTPGTETLTTQSLRFLDFGSPQLANATILIVGLVVMVVVALAQKLFHVDIATGLGG